MPRKKSWMIIGITVPAILCGCECSDSYVFEVRNTSSYTVEISFIYGVSDSVVVVTGEAPVTICSAQGGLYSCLMGELEDNEGPQDDVESLLEFVEVRTADGPLSSRNYLDNDAWFFSEGTFRAYVTDAEFE